MAIASTCFEARAHSRRKLGSTFVCVQRGPTLKYVYELVLFGMGVTKGRNGIGSQACEVYPKVPELEKVAELALFSAHHA